MGTKTHACGIDTNPKKKNMFALTSSSSAIARSRVASAAAGRSSRLKVIAKKNCDSAPIRILSTKDKEVALNDFTDGEQEPKSDFGDRELDGVRGEPRTDGESRRYRRLAVGEEIRRILLRYVWLFRVF